MEAFYADGSSSTVNITPLQPLPHATIYSFPLNRNLGFNDPPEEEQGSSNSIIYEEGNMVFNSCEHDFLAEHSEDFPIITSVFSLASTSNESKKESDNLQIEFIDNQFTPLNTQTEIPNTFNHTKTAETCNYSPSFVVKRNRNSITSQIRTTEENNTTMNPSSHGFLTGHHITPGSDNIPSNLLSGNSIGRKYDCPCDEQPQLVANCTTSDATKDDIMRKREKRIHQLKNLLLKKKAEVEKVRYLSKKNSLLFTIDKLKDRLFTRTDALEDQTYVAHPYPVSEKLPSKMPNLDLKYRDSCSGLSNLVLDRNVRKETNTKSVEKIKWKNNEQKSTDQSEIVGGSAGHEKRRRGRPKKLLAKSNMTTDKTKKLSRRIKNPYSDNINAENCSRLNMPPPAIASASLKYPDHSRPNATYNNHTESVFSNFPVHFQNSVAKLM